MATLDDVARFALELPAAVEVETARGRAWSVGGTTFVWERPFTKADVRRFGGAPVPTGPIVAVRVDDLGEKDVILGAGHTGVFTIPHFDGYAAVLIQLRTVTTRALREAIVDGWLACAPTALADAYVAEEAVRRRR
jgi:hypothetical protein